MLVLLVIFGYTTQPKVQDPKDILHKLDQIAFADTNLSLSGLNAVEVTRKLFYSNKLQLQGYGKFNVSSGHSEEGLKLSYKFRL